MNRFLMYVEFQGALYYGWQKQITGPSVQGELEKAILEFCGETARVQGCGRTDSGVNALSMPAHVDLELDVEPRRLMAAINAKLRPQPISILNVEQVDPTFHARFSCTERSYLYKLINRRAPLTFDKGLAWSVFTPVDVEAMQLATKQLIGTHDFSTFRAAACQGKTPIRTLDELTITSRPLAQNGQEIEFHLRARSFLHNQVRATVGSLVQVGTGKWSQEDFTSAFEARDRTRGGQNAPPEGLYFADAKF